MAKRKSAPEPEVRLPSVRVPKSLRDAAKAKSKETGISMSFVIRKALEQFANSDGNLRGAEK